MEEFLITRDTRKILHVDMDAFYAQVEMLEHPELKSKPLIIAHDPAETGGRGVVTTANYEARRLGVHSAMSAIEARQIVPDGIFLTPNFQKYKVMSQRIHHIFNQFTKKIEPVAFDEAYLDMTESVLPGADIAAKIRHEILKQTGLTSSIGVSHNKLLAKLGSEYNKPNGVTVITSDNMIPFLDELPIGEFRGIGAKSQVKFAQMGIKNGQDLRRLSKETLKGRFGKIGEHLYWQARGVHFAEVDWQHQRQSIGKEETYNHTLNSETDVLMAFRQLAQSMVKVLTDRQLTGRTLNIKIRDSSFRTITRSITQNSTWHLSATLLAEQAQRVFDDIVQPPFDIRLLGLSMTNLQSARFEEMTLF